MAKNMYSQIKAFEIIAEKARKEKMAQDNAHRNGKPIKTGQFTKLVNGCVFTIKGRISGKVKHVKFEDVDIIKYQVLKITRIPVGKTAFDVMSELYKAS